MAEDVKIVDENNLEEEVELVEETSENQQSEEPSSSLNLPEEPKEPNKVLRVLRSQKGWLWMIPMLACLAIFTFWPIINTLISAFRVNYVPFNLQKPDDGFGFQNFATAVTDGYFLNSLFNTFFFTFVSVPLSTLIALLISVALSSIKKLQGLYQSILFLPYLTNALAIGAVFYTMFQVIGTTSNVETWGLINTIFGTHVHWVDADASTWAMRFVVIFYEVWAGLPFKILILFGALQNVNKQYYDAAKIDGASKGTVLWKITVPLISPMISYLLTTGIIGGFKAYSAVVGIFGPNMGPKSDYEMGTIVGLIYRYIGDGGNQIGVASAASLVLFAIIMVITLINQQISKRRVHY